MNKKILCLAVLVISLNVAGCASEMNHSRNGGNNRTEYYVAPNGNDNNNGAINSPWKSAYKAFSSAKPGQTVYFRQGTYFTDKVLNKFSTQATAETRITFKGYPGETAIITSMKLRDDPKYWTRVLGYDHVYSTELQQYIGPKRPLPRYIPNCSEDGVPLDRMAAYRKNCGPQDLTGPGQWVRNAKDRKIYVWSTDGKNPGTHKTEICEFIYGGNSTINLQTGRLNRSKDHTGYDYITFEDLILEGGHYPINIGSDYVELKNCIIRNCYGDGIKGNGCRPADHDNPDDPTDLNYWNASYGLIENCTIYNTHESSIDITGGDYWIIRGCKIYGIYGDSRAICEWCGHTAIMLKNNNIGTIVEGNELIGGRITIGGSSFNGIADEAVDIIVKNNIFRDRTGKPDVVYFCAAKNCSFVNNLIYNCELTTAVIHMVTTDVSKPKYNNRDCTIKNNIFYNIRGTQYIYRESTVGCSIRPKIDYNIIDGSMKYRAGGKDYSLEEFRAIGYEKNSITATPTFANLVSGDFHPLKTSPQINTGIPNTPTTPGKYNSYVPGEVDFDGNRRVDDKTGIVDIGPYEYHGISR